MRLKESFVTLQDKKGQDYAVDIEKEESEREAKKKSKKGGKLRQLARKVLDKFRKKK